MCKDFLCAVSIWHPYPLQLFVFDALLVVHLVHAAEEPGIEAHFSKESGIGVGVAKWINLPADSWLDAKFFKNEIVADHMIVDHVFVGWACLVVHGPSSASDLKLATFY